MRPRPWAIDELVINEGEDWSGAEWVSVLKGWNGLPEVQPQMAGRYGAWPVIGGIERPGRQLFLETIWAMGASAQESARRQTMQQLNPERVLTRRLVAADSILPGGGGDETVILALGPWDVYQDDDGDWHARDLLRPDTVEADITSLGDFADGRGDRVRAIEVSGSTEVSLDDEVSIISGEDTLTFRVVAQMAYAHDGGSWPNTHNYLFDARGASDSHRIGLYYDTADDKFKVFVNGGDRLESAAQTFDADDWVELVVTVDFDNDAYALYIDGAEADTDSTALSAPTPTAWEVGADYAGNNEGDFVIQEYQVLAGALSAAEVAWINGQDLRARWLDVLCMRTDPWQEKIMGQVATLQVDGDVRWRSRDGDVVVWSCTDGDEEETVDVDSDDDVYPVIRVTPKQAKGGGAAYKRWVPVLWTVSDAHNNYPYMLGTFDTDALVTAGKAQADGDDWRVSVDGAEVDRWFGDSGTSQFDQTATKTWVNLDFQAGVELTLAAGFGSGDTVETLDFNEATTGLPSEGILLLDNGANTEAFTYTGKNDSLKRVTGVTRAAKGTTARTFSASDDATWVQHDIWITYGDAGASAPSQDDDYKPIFDLGDSTNTSWVYEEFGEDDGLRTGAWASEVLDATPVFYNGNRGAAADPWIEIGIECYLTREEEARWYLYNPCGITDVNFTNGEKYSAYRPDLWGGRIQSSSNGISWTNEYTIPIPSTTSTWESWSRNESLASDAIYVALFLYDFYESMGRIEAADCTVTLDSSNTPTHSIGDEQGGYELAMMLTNETTGDAIEVALTMAVDETVEIDTDAKTVTLLDDGTRQFQVLTLTGGARRDWLRLEPGENDLHFEDADTVEVEIVIVWDRRYFE